MGTRLRKTAVVSVATLAAFFAIAQFIQPARTNPPVITGRALEAQTGTPSDFVAVINRSCADCHSNTTDWSRYTRVAPVSWLVTYGVNGGRTALNFSEWGSYSPAQQHALLTASCADARSGKMPGSAYIRVRPEARLSAKDIAVICFSTSSGQ